MFDLNQSIAEWRRQMIAAGIKTPVPLEELESHLREDIERQMEAGADLAQAFAAAVQRIGHGDELEKEFKKVEAPRKMRARELLRRWSVILGTGFVYSVLSVTWFMGARSGKMEITLPEIGLALGAMAPMIGLGWAGRSLAKHLPVTNEGIILVTAFGMILLGAAALRLFWGALTPDNLVHVQIIVLWSLSPFLGVGHCVSAWHERCATLRQIESH
jgi:hypothetical protein